MSAEQTVDTSASQGSPAGNPQREYGFSVLLTGLSRLGRQPVGFLLVIALNAVVQMLLMMWTPIISDSVAFWISSALSLVILVLCFSWICRLALATVDGKIGLGELFKATPRGLGLFAIWVIAELLIVFVLASLWFWPGLVAMLLMPFVAIAAIDGKRNAMAVNFLAIRQRPGRYLITAALWIILMTVSWLLLVLGSITLSPVVLGLLGWLFKGLVGAWLTCAFVALYRSTPVGAGTDDGIREAELSAADAAPQR